MDRVPARQAFSAASFSTACFGVSNVCLWNSFA